MDQPVGPEQPLAVQLELFALLRQISPIFQCIKRMGEPGANIHPKLVPEIARAHVAKLGLEDQLADHPFFISWCKAPANRQLAIVEPADIWLEVMLILEMGAA